jgi:hypothetical protein
MFRHRRRHESIWCLIEEIKQEIEEAEERDDSELLAYINQDIARFYLWWQRHNSLSSATQLTLNLTGGKRMATFTINTTDGLAEFQYTNSAGAPVAGPNDSVTGSPVAPEATSDNPAALTVATSVAGATDGLWTAALTPVAAGAANVVPSVLVNSDGSDVNETEGPNTGQPFAVPASVQVTVTPDNTPTGFSLTVTG